jgi:hypothetical protein
MCGRYVAPDATDLERHLNPRRARPCRTGIGDQRMSGMAGSRDASRIDAVPAQQPAREWDNHAL